jgi:hypothetical protein
MLLLGGYDRGSGSEQTGIWELKEDQWSRIGEFSKVWNIIPKKSNSCISARTYRICYLHRQIRLLLRTPQFSDLPGRPGWKRRARSSRRNRKTTRRILLFSRPLPNTQVLLYLNCFLPCLILTFSNNFFLLSFFSFDLFENFQQNQINNKLNHNAAGK